MTRTSTSLSCVISSLGLCSASGLLQHECTYESHQLHGFLMLRQRRLFKLGPPRYILLHLLPSLTTKLLLC